MEAGVRIFFRSICRVNHLLTAPRTLITIQPSLKWRPLNQHRLLSHESTDTEERHDIVSTFDTTKAYYSHPREKSDDQSFPSSKSPLNNETWRQFLTSDEKTIVCVHPAKSVQLQDTKVTH